MNPFITATFPMSFRPPDPECRGGGYSPVTAECIFSKSTNKLDCTVYVHPLCCKNQLAICVEGTLNPKATLRRGPDQMFEKIEHLGKFKYVSLEEFPNLKLS